MANDRSIGTLSLWDQQIRQYTEDEVSLLTAFADQAALALEKARLLNEAEREKERSDALYRVSNLLAGAYDTGEVLNLIVNEAARLVGAAGSYMRLIENNILVAAAVTDSVSDFVAGLVPNISIEEGKRSLSGHAMATRKPLVIADGAEDSWGPVESRRRAQEFGFHGMAVVPLLVNDRALGTLSVTDTRIRLFTEDEVSLLTAFADQASLALEKARLLKEAEREKERSDALYQISNRLAGVHETDEVLDLIVNEATRLVGASGAFIRLLKGDGLVATTATESVAEYLFSGTPVLPVTEGISNAGHVMATKKPVVSEDSTESELSTPQIRLRLKQHGFHARATVPMLANDESIGVLTVMDKRIRRFTDDEVSLLTAFADQASLALEKARLLNQAEARERQANQLYGVTTQLASNHDLDSVLDLITQQAVGLMDGNSGMLFRFDESRGGLVAVNNFKMRPEILDSLVLPWEGIAGRAYQERRIMWTSDYSVTIEDPSYTSGDRSTSRRQISDWAQCPSLALPS